MIRSGYFLFLLTLAILLNCTLSLHASEKVVYRLKWRYNTSVAGDLFALDKNYFKDAGLQVEIKAGGPERDAIRELELGHAHFGVASADQVIRAKTKGSPIIVIAQLFQKNPLQWIYRAKNGPITKLSDLSDKSIGITHGGNDETIMYALLSRGGINKNTIRFFSVRYDYTPFYQGKVTIWPVYRNSQGIILEKKLKENGEAVLFLKPYDYGIQFVANSVVVSEKFIKTHPETVQKFTTALLSGWRAAIKSENEIDTLNVLKKYDRDTSTDIRKKQLYETRHFIIPETGRELGEIDIPAWKQTEQIMLDQHLISDKISIEKYLLQFGLKR